MYFSELAEFKYSKHTCFLENDVSGWKVGDVTTLDRLAGMLHFEWNLAVFPRGKRA